MTGLAVVRRSDGGPVGSAEHLLAAPPTSRSGAVGSAGRPRVWDDGVTSVAVRGTDGALCVAEDLVVAVAGRVPALTGDERQEDAAARVARRWRKHGAAGLLGLPDDVVVVVVGRRSDEVTVFRDVGGAVPAHMYASDAEAVVTTSLPELVRSSRALSPDERWVSSYVANRWPPPGRTPYAEVAALRPGWLATLTDGGWVQRAHDRVHIVDTTPASLADAAARFRELLDAAVLRRVVEVPGPVAVTLSGGLDSSSILTTVRAVAPEADLIAVCLRFSAPPGDERVHQVEAAAAAGARLLWVDTDRTPGPFGVSPETVFAQHGAPPLAGNWFLHEGLVAAAVDAGATRVMDGEDADSLLGAGVEYLADLAANEGPRALLCELVAVRHRYGSSWPLLVRTSLEELCRSAGHRWGRASSLAARGMLDGGFLGALMGEAFERWEPLPGGISHPFLDRRLMEFALALPGQHRVRGTLTKAVLRTAMADRLPPGVLARTDKARLSEPLREALLGPQWDCLQDGLSAARRAAPDIRAVPVVERAPVGTDRLYRAYRFALVAHWRAWLTQRRSFQLAAPGFSGTD